MTEAKINDFFANVQFMAIASSAWTAHLVAEKPDWFPEYLQAVEEMLASNATPELSKRRQSALDAAVEDCADFLMYFDLLPKNTKEEEQVKFVVEVVTFSAQGIIIYSKSPDEKEGESVS